MGFRNPVTIAEGVDTGNLQGARVYTAASSDATDFGRLETASVNLATGVEYESAAYLEVQSTPNLAGETIGALAKLSGVAVQDPTTLLVSQPRIELFTGPTEADGTSIDLRATAVTLDADTITLDGALDITDTRYAQLLRGAGTYNTNATGDITITHNMGVIPSAFIVQSRFAGAVDSPVFAVRTLTATTAGVRVYYNGAVLASFAGLGLYFLAVE